VETSDDAQEAGRERDGRKCTHWDRYQTWSRGSKDDKDSRWSLESGEALQENLYACLDKTTG